MSRRYYRKYKKDKAESPLEMILDMIFTSLSFLIKSIFKIPQKIQSTPEAYLPYKKKESLLTASESNFEKVLKEVVQNKYHIDRQVLLSNLVETTDKYKPHRSKIDKKTIDFVLFQNNSHAPYLAIELDDLSHLRPDRIERDLFVESVLNKAGIRLIRIKNSYSYNLKEISDLIFNS